MAISAPVLAGISLASTVLGTGLGIAGQIQQANVIEAQSEFQAAVLRNNQILAERAARDAEARGRVAEQRQRMQTAQLEARQRAVFAGSGVDVSTGSPLDVFADTARFGELDALTIRGNAAREAASLRAQGMGFESQARLQELQGQQAQSALPTAIGSTLLSGTGTVAQKWYGFKTQDVFGSQRRRGGTGEFPFTSGII